MMEVQYSHTPVVAKRLWNVLRITFFMIRKGLVSKRKLMMDMNMMMKRGKLLRKSLSNLMSHHHHHHSNRGSGGYGIQEYEFSCSNSPNPVFFHLPKRKRHHYNNYFPCINPPQVIDEQEEQGDIDIIEHDPKAVVLVPKTPDDQVDSTFNFQIDYQFAAGEKRSPLLQSPFSVRVSNYSSLDQEDEINGNSNSSSRQVDDAAEEFIKRFYEQLRAQSRIQLLPYQEDI